MSGIVRASSPNIVQAKRRAPVEDESVVQCSSFINVEFYLPDEEIRELSELKSVKVSTPDDDMTRLPNRHEYEYFFDYVQKVRGAANEVPEERVPSDIEQEYLSRIEALVEQYTNEMPNLMIIDEDCTLTPEQQEFYLAWSKSVYKQEYFSYLDSVLYDRTMKGRGKTQSIPREHRVYPHYDIYEHYRVDVIQSVYQVYMQRLAKVKSVSSKQVLKSLATSYLSVEDVKLLISNFRVCKNKLPPNLPPCKSFQPEVEEFLIGQLEDPCCTRMSLTDRVKSVKDKFGVMIKPSDLSEFMRMNGATRKLVRGVVPEADNIPHRNARVKVVMKMVQLLEEGRLMVSVDETQINKNCIYDKYGWALKGQTAIAQVGRHGKPVHIIAAVLRDRVVGYMLRDERINDYSFKHFLTCLFARVKQLIPDYKRRCFFLIDNAGAHKTKIVKDYIETEGVTVLCNAPMTPHIQPIEYVFSMFKRNLSKHAYSDRSDLIIQVYKAFLSVAGDPRRIFNTYIHCLKTCAPALTFQELSRAVKPQTNAKLYGKLSDTLQVFNEVKKLIKQKREG
jgi:transposase